MNTVIGWLKLAAIVCSVSSGSAVSEGKCTIAAGLPPPSRSVNAFSMLKGSAWGRVLMVIARKPSEYAWVTCVGMDGVSTGWVILYIYASEGSCTDYSRSESGARRETD